MIRLGPLLCTWFSKSAKITGIGNPMIRLSRLMTIVFLIAVSNRHRKTVQRLPIFPLVCLVRLSKMRFIKLSVRSHRKTSGNTLLYRAAHS